MQIGELFILRINIHLQGSVLDSPELMWAEPQLEPVYVAVRSYLEMDQRVGLLTERLDVIADLLAVLKDQLSHSHGEYLEWIGMFSACYFFFFFFLGLGSSCGVGDTLADMVRGVSNHPHRGRNPRRGCQYCR